MWTKFHNMTGKTEYSNVYIEAPQLEAALIFHSRFNFVPSKDEYEIVSDESIEKLTEVERRGLPLEEYKKSLHVTFIYK